MHTAILSYDEYGDTSEHDTVMFIHGASGSKLGWRGIADKLADKYHILVVDAPGHGDSIEKASPWSLQRSVTLHADVIRARAHEGRAHLVGFSLGGFTALALAKRHPDLVASLFISGAYDLRAAWGRKLHLSPLQNIPDLILPKSILIAGMHRMGMKGMNAEMYDAQQRAGKVVGQKFSDIRDMRLPPASPAGAWQLAAPTLLVAGDKHDNVPVSQALADELALGNPRSHLVVLRDTIHAWGLQHPQLFTKLVDDWLQKKQIPGTIDPDNL